MVLKYTEEYALQTFEQEFCFLRHLLLDSECKKLGYESVIDALIKNKFNKDFVYAILDNSYDCEKKLRECGLIFNENFLNMKDELIMAQEGRMDYIHSWIMNTSKWKKLMFKFFTDTYVTSITEQKQKKRVEI